MSEAKWRGYEKPAGASFVPLNVNHGTDCPRKFPRKCYGTLYRLDQTAKCDDCGATYTRDDLKRHGINLDKL